MAQRKRTQHLQSHSQLFGLQQLPDSSQGAFDSTFNFTKVQNIPNNDNVVLLNITKPCSQFLGTSHTLSDHMLIINLSVIDSKTCKENL